MIAQNRNWAAVVSHLGWCKFWTGCITEAIALQERAIRLSPRDPYIGIWYYRIGYGHLLDGRTDEAIVWFEGARRQSRTPPGLRLPAVTGSRALAQTLSFSILA